MADRRERAARAYLGGATLRDVAAQVGCDPSTVRAWLLVDGVPMRPRGARARVDVEAVDRMRRAGSTWAQIAAELGVSASGTRKRYRTSHDGDPGEVDHHRHLSDRDRRVLVAAWQARPELAGSVSASGQPGRWTVGRGGDRVRGLLRRHHERGVTWRELAAVLGVSDTRVRQIAIG